MKGMNGYRKENGRTNKQKTSSPISATGVSDPFLNAGLRHCSFLDRYPGGQIRLELGCRGFSGCRG